MGDVRIEAFEGNTRDYLFELREFNQRDARDVSGATNIWLELSYPNGTPMTRVQTDRNHADADWASGLVVGRVAPTNATGVVGVYPFALTVEESGEVETVASGLVVVRDRPGFPHP